jgi:hypothetical protein
MPITYALNMFGLSFATLTALLVWVTLDHRHVMVEAARRIPTVVMESLPGRPKIVNDDETGSPEVPMWWYLISCLVALFMTIFAVEYWDVGLRWYGVLLALVIALVFFPPVRTTSNVSLPFVYSGGIPDILFLACPCLRNGQYQDQH